MFKSLGQRLQNKKQKVNLWNREFDIVPEGLDEAQVSRFVEELMDGNNGSGMPSGVVKKLMERAVADAEKIVANIKAEAQNEAVKIIDEAKHDAEDIVKREKLQIEKEAEEILQILKKNTKNSEKEAKKIVQNLLIKVKTEIENEVRKEYKETHSRLLYSLLGTSEVTLKPIDIEEPVIEAIAGTEKEPEAERVEEKEEAIAEVVEEPVGESEEETIAEVIEEPEEVEKETQKTREEVKSEKQEDKKAKEEEKRAKKEAEKLEREQKKREDEELKKARKEQKQQQKEEQPSFLARFNAFRERLNEKLSQPIGSKGTSPDSRPVRVQAQAPVHREVEGEPAGPPHNVEPSVEKAQAETYQDKSRELMNLIYAEEMPEIPEQSEEAREAVEPENVKAVEEIPAMAEEDEVKPVEQKKKTPDAAGITDKKEAEEPPAEILKQDEGILHSGDVEMSVEVPVNLVAVSKLYNYLQSTPDVKVLYTKGSWDKATTIMISMDKPLPIIDMISRIPGIHVTARTSHSESEIKGASASLLGTKKGEITKISLTLTEG